MGCILLFFEAGFQVVRRYKLYCILSDSKPLSHLVNKFNDTLIGES